MFANSPRVESSQTETHPRLADVVRRHRDHRWRAPLHAATQQQFQRWQAARVDASRPLLVDLGCGNGDSSLRLAELHAEVDVLGVDQSAQRLFKHAPLGYAQHGRVTVMRAEAASVLRLIADAGIRIDLLYLLYPNPWPKPEHLLRRWHGHPVFPVLLANADRIVLRTNWRVYAQEFAVATLIYGRSAQCTDLDADTVVLTPFEAKYVASGHDRCAVSVT